MSSTSIYKPTWLYIKQHNQTGLKYFGKTTRPDPYRYKGSGEYWKAHLKKHGSDITTVCCHLYTNRDELIEEALAFSRAHDIVHSVDSLGKKIWANKIIEDGLGGRGIPGHKQTPEHIESRVKHIRGRFISEKEREQMKLARARHPPRTPESKLKTSVALTGLKRSEESRDRMRKPKSEQHKINMRKPKEKVRCPHCGKIGGKGNMVRYHFANCHDHLG